MKGKEFRMRMIIEDFKERNWKPGEVIPLEWLFTSFGVGMPTALDATAYASCDEFADIIREPAFMELLKQECGIKLLAGEDGCAVVKA
jgi:hypothetical protein